MSYKKGFGGTEFVFPSATRSRSDGWFFFLLVNLSASILWLCVQMRGSCKPGKASDGSRLAICQTLSINSIIIASAPVRVARVCAITACYRHASVVFMGSLQHVSASHLFFLVLSCVVIVFLCSRWSFVNVPLICFYIQQTVYRIDNNRILPGMVKTRSVIVKNTSTRTSRSEGWQGENGDRVGVGVGAGNRDENRGGGGDRNKDRNGEMGTETKREQKQGWRRED